jgi:hypothetical protein
VRSAARAGGYGVLVALIACACSRDQAEPPAPRGSVVLSPGPTATATAPAKPTKGARAAAAKAGKGTKPPAIAGAVDAGASPDAKVVELEELKTEEPEANPFSESVTLKLTVTPPVKAVVLYGAKQLGHLEPGKMEAEITRPRGSGPVDVEVKAEGYLPYHTRLYADRNDKLNVRLYRPEEAPNIFGYSRSAEGKKAAADKERAQRN